MAPMDFCTLSNRSDGTRDATGLQQSIHIQVGQHRAGDYTLRSPALADLSRPSADVPVFIPLLYRCLEPYLNLHLPTDASAALGSAPEQSETVDLIGPMYSARQLGDILGTALGKRLQVVDIPEAGQVEAMIQAGLPRPVAEVYAEMHRAIGSGLITGKRERTVVGTTAIDDILPDLLDGGQTQAAS